MKQDAENAARAANAWLATSRADRLRKDRERARRQAEREHFGARGRPRAPSSVAPATENEEE